MIEARQYNIGNLVYVDNEKYHPKLKNIPLEITSISECIGLENDKTYSIGLKHINQLPNTYYETYSQFIRFIKPIELTEDLLLKCGFKRLNKSFLINNGYVIHFEKNLIMCVKSGVLLSTLHQLQNLYWILTGQELEINL